MVARLFGADSSGRFSGLLIAIVFALGMFTAFALIKFLRPDLGRETPDAGGLMSSYGRQQASTQKWFLWLGSVTIGILNVLALFVVNIWLRTGR